MPDPIPTPLPLKLRRLQLQLGPALVFVLALGGAIWLWSRQELGGTVAGDHDVIFAGPEERLILSHRAENRMIFARGALTAAKFLVGKPAGVYSMRDVIDAL